ncbi:MAG: glycosyltransferase, partial [Patescibacteria group bacterium]|nr:glycosyltransferase [Patescibacteria group bacterium]
MKKIKVMHFITGLEVGGAEMMLLKTLPRFSKKFENFVCSAGGGKIADELRKKNIRVYCFELTKWRIISAIKEFGQIIKKEKPDLLVTYLIHADLFGRFFGRIFGIKKIICSKRTTALRRKFAMFLDRLSYFLIAKYICVSQNTADELINFWKFPKGKVIVVPNAVELDRFVVQIDKNKKRQELGLKKDDLVITFTANLKNGKGHDYLLRSFAKIYKKFPKLKLVLIGKDQGIEGELKQLAKDLKIKNQVLFLGFREDVIDILKISDVFVFPSLFEGMSNALLEGAAAHLAVVASDIDPNKEIITHNKTGLLF